MCLLGMSVLFYAVPLQLKAGSGVGVWLPSSKPKHACLKISSKNLCSISGDPPDCVTEKGKQDKQTTHLCTLGFGLTLQNFC